MSKRIRVDDEFIKLLEEIKKKFREYGIELKEKDATKFLAKKLKDKKNIFDIFKW